MMLWNDRLKLAVKSWKSTEWMGEAMPILRMDRALKDSGVRDLVKELEDERHFLDATMDVMVDLVATAVEFGVPQGRDSMVNALALIDAYTKEMEESLDEGA